MSAFDQYDRLPGNDQLRGYPGERQRAWKLELILCWLDSCTPGLRKAAPVQGNLRRRSLRLLAAGSKSQDIADKLFIGLRTVHSHRQSLLQKLNVNNTAELIRVALELKLISP